MEALNFIETKQDGCPLDNVLMSQLGLHSSQQKNLDYCRFSESPLWSTQRQYFTQQGVNPWRNRSLPFYATSNPALAKSYAKVIVQYWQDAIAVGDIDPDHPVYVVELGCGSGAFSFYMVRAIEYALRQSAIDGLDWRFLCTDIGHSNLRFIANHPKLNRYFENGVMAAGCFDVETQNKIQLLDGNELHQFANAPVVISNYVFDGLTNDVFHLHYGDLYEGKVGLIYKERNDTHQNNTCISGKQFEAANPFNNIELDFQWSAVDKIDWLSPVVSNQVDQYRNRFDSSVLLYPTGAIQCVEHIREMSHGRFLLLSADKGFYTDQDVRLQPVPFMTIHGSFSLPVNFHALKTYADDHGALSWQNQQRQGGLVYSIQLFSHHSEYFGNTQSCVEDQFLSCSPDHLLPILSGVRKTSGSYSMDTMLGFIRLYDYDPRILDIFLPALLSKSEALDVVDKHYWKNVLDKVWSNTYDIGSSVEFVFDLGAFALDIGHYPLAKNAFSEIKNTIPDPANSFNLAIANMNLANWQEAVSSLDDTIHTLARNGDAQLGEEELLLDAVNLRDYCKENSKAEFGKKISQDDNPCFLTPLNMQYSEEIVHQFRDGNISELTRLPFFCSVDDVNGWIDEENASKTKEIYCVFHREIGFVGLLGLHFSGDSGYFYFCIGTDYQNKGFGTHSLSLLNVLAKRLGVNHMYSGVYACNKRSQKVISNQHFSRLEVKASDPDADLNFYHHSVSGEELPSDVLIDKLAKLLTEIDSPIKLI
ncbi:GNAT family N-acetyltransferase [Teredinibacter sp. KSP-S5-2]|uniref:GNAT family N-acetyltransferase n=1 Tax=Teredinibacter sp. KSP-S5-2 TaxID=3034506 RepID=UPI00293483AA|nr:GNAT family N-acetyltransferase [Teredinibacter sp. KSP-S5-2]WNO11624.1 GNAT family N-acetyltransferase [Teredinibacter sp. KSP-S5-2]